MSDRHHPSQNFTSRRDARFAPPVTAKRPWQTLKRMSHWFKPQSHMMVFMAVVVLLDGLIVLTLPWLMGKSIDALGRGLGWLLLALLSGYLLDALLNTTQQWTMAGLSQRVVAGVRTSLFAKLDRLPVAFFDFRPDGDLMSRFTNDIDAVSSAIAQSTTQLMSSVIAVVGSLTMMLLLSPLLTLAALLGAPLVVVLSRVITSRTRKLFQEQQRTLGLLNGHIEETITGFDIVKAFHREETVVQEFERQNSRLAQIAVRAQTWAGLAMPLTNVIGNLSFVAVGVSGSWMALQGWVTVGLIASFLVYSRQFVRPINDLATIWNTLQAALAGAERVLEIMDEPEEADVPGTVWQDGHGDVQFQNVSFSYVPGNPVLHDVSFHVPAGETLALVGATGAGKTTVVNLLTRFYEASEGKVLLDGRDVKDYTRSSLRKAFGVVLQDTFLFSGTVRDNLRYGCPDATDEEVEKAGVLSHADAFIRRLPHGYDTHLTEGGAQLSQGQRQLLAIARVVLMDPPLLILDEATSNVDTRTELQLQQAMLSLRKNRTSFVIAHRLSTIREAHTILVLDQGRVVERGNHEQLLNARGVYARLYESQTLA
ncbi:MAG: ABC transporter ATP-binding protein [Spirochaetales bacterium]|nr:ABC transporter ATP-binding protein [Spirochaetales bacterium]